VVERKCLTALETRVLLFAAESIAEDIDHFGLSGPEKAAYERAIRKLRAVRRSASGD
jgi:hypothetical protein